MYNRAKTEIVFSLNVEEHHVCIVTVICILDTTSRIQEKEELQLRYKSFMIICKRFPYYCSIIYEKDYLHYLSGLFLYCIRNWCGYIWAFSIREKMSFRWPPKYVMKLRGLERQFFACRPDEISWNRKKVSWLGSGFEWIFFARFCVYNIWRFENCLTLFVGSVANFSS